MSKSMPKAHIIGLGRSGIAAARLLQRNGWEVQISDRSDTSSLQELQQTLATDGILVNLGHTPTLVQNSPDLVVVSPGVPWDIPSLVAARQQGIEVIGEMELAWRYLKASSWVGITGTNGKTTTTALIAAMFQAADIDATACGNIGYAACELALQRSAKPQPHPSDWVIAEMSSYQIESSFTLAPKIGLWTTLTPDHLSRHKTLENYYQIKASLLRRCQYQVFNGDDPYLHQVGLQEWPDAYWTSVEGKANLIGDPQKSVYLEDNWIVAFGELIAPVNLFKMFGAHNQQNLLMAVAAARLGGIDKAAITQAIATFPGVPHRLESIMTLAGVEFVNDSKATNYDAAVVGLASVQAPAVLIAGGEAKDGNDQAWMETIKTQAAAVLLIGDAATAFAQRLQQVGYDHYEIVETMDKAVQRSLAVAEQYQAKTVLLSPACASFDQYQSFEHRGDHFRQLCLQLKSI